VSRRAGGWLGSERGAGSIIVVGVLAALLMLVMLAAPLAAAHLYRRRAAGAADAAALAAADTVVGIVSGDACANAVITAEANGATLTGCVVDDLVVTVSVARASGLLSVTAVATAGPPATR
jgi:secretion/DNA translocation related TadE-like protein